MSIHRTLAPFLLAFLAGAPSAHAKFHAPQFSITPLGSLLGPMGFSGPTAISDGGGTPYVAGWSQVNSATDGIQRHAVVWHEGQTIDIGAHYGGDSIAIGINRHGVVVGEAGSGLFVYTPGAAAPYFDLTGALEAQLADLRIELIAVLGVTDDGRVTGSFQYFNADINGYERDLFTFSIPEGGDPRQGFASFLPLTPTSWDWMATASNAAGWIAGGQRVAPGGPAWWFGWGQHDAGIPTTHDPLDFFDVTGLSLWGDISATAYVDLGGGAQQEQAFAHLVDSTDPTAPAPWVRAPCWQANLIMGDDNCGASAINRYEVMVGDSHSELGWGFDHTLHAVAYFGLRSTPVALRLDDLVPDPQNPFDHLKTAIAISDSDLIVGKGVLRATGYEQAYLLTPVSGSSPPYFWVDDQPE